MSDWLNCWLSVKVSNRTLNDSLTQWNSSGKQLNDSLTQWDSSGKLRNSNGKQLNDSLTQWDSSGKQSKDWRVHLLNRRGQLQNYLGLPAHW